MSGPPDKPGLAEVIALYQENFGDSWKDIFRETVTVRLNYEYTEADQPSS